MSIIDVVAVIASILIFVYMAKVWLDFSKEIGRKIKDNKPDELLSLAPVVKTIISAIIIIILLSTVLT